MVAAAENTAFSSYEMRTLKSHEREVVSVAWSCNGKRLASGGHDSVIKIWTPALRSTSKAERPETELPNAGSIMQLCWDPVNADRLFSVSTDKALRLWDVKNARCLGSLKLNGHQHSAWHPSGLEILHVDVADTFSVISVSTLKVVRSGRFKSRLNSFCFSMDGNMLYVVSASRFLHVLTYETFERLRSVALHTVGIVCVKLAPDNKYLCTGGSDASVAIVDVNELVASRYLHCDAEVQEVSISPDAQWLAFFEWSSPGICIASAETGRIVQRVDTQYAVSTLAWNPKPPGLPVLAFAGGTSYDSRGDIYGLVCIYAGPAK